MKDPILLHFKQFAALGAISRLLVVSLGLMTGAFGQDAETVSLWREWMSVLQREPSQTSGPRLYLMTDRKILQTSPEKASFQNGRYRMVLADGSVPDVDGDLDYYTDVFEDGNTFANRNNPNRIPRDGNGNPLEQDADFISPILIANGSLLGIADTTISSNTAAKLVREAGGTAVRLIGAPASNLVRPFSFRDFSSRFYYYVEMSGQPTGTYKNYPLALYYTDKDFPNPQDCSALETSMVPGAYTVEFPTIANAPFGKSTAQVAHKLVPNGALTLGLKKPTWLVRSLKSYVKDNTAPVEQSWVNGRLKFDPYLPLDITWDNIAASGLASSADYIEMWLEDENLGQVSYTFRVRATTSSLSISLTDSMYLFYGNIADRLAGEPLDLYLPDQVPAPPINQSFNGHIVMKYMRYANSQASADLSSVTVRVPIEMYVSYASWRKELFSMDSNNDSISGPDADPDKDGLTNKQEFEQGTDPKVSSIGIVNATSQDVATVAATLGATVVQDPLTTDNPLYTGSALIYDRGVVYSPTSVNASPVIDGPGVVRIVSPPAEAGAFTVAVNGLTPATKYSYRGYVITSTGTYYTTPVSSFTTVGLPPVVTLPTVTSPTSASLTATSAKLGGNVTSDGNSPIIERGVVFSPTSSNNNPFVGDPGVTQVQGTGTTGVFTVDVTGLAAGTAYSFRAYAINAVGISHTTVVGTFTTFNPPVITTPTSTNVTAFSATLGGNVTASGGLPILQRGVVFSLTSANNNPAIGGTGVTVFPATTTGTGVFTVNATGLSPAKSYSFKAYAVNSVGTSYTVVGTFTTPATLPVVTSPTIKNITTSSATLGATVTSDGGSAIVERGFVYAPTAVDNNPNIGNPGTIKVTAPTNGAFSAVISGLIDNTSYTFKPYATNVIGTAYGVPYAFFATYPALMPANIQALPQDSDPFSGLPSFNPQNNGTSLPVPFNSTLVAATYEGLVFDPDQGHVFHQKLTLSKSGSFSSSLRGLASALGGSLKGTFNPNGYYFSYTPKGPQGIVSIEMQMYMEAPDQWVVFGLAQTSTGALLGIELRQAKYGKTNPYAFPGRVTMTMPMASGGAGYDGPQGAGAATGSIDNKGKLTLSMYMPDGGTASYSGPILTRDCLALYGITNSRNKSVLIGAMDMKSGTGDVDHTGYARFYSNSGIANSLFSMGFDQSRSLELCRYVPPLKGMHPLPGFGSLPSSASLDFDGGDFDGVGDIVAWSASNEISIVKTSAKSGSASFNSSTGLFSCSFTLTDAGRQLDKVKATANAVVLQNASKISGYYTDDSGGGSFSVNTP